MITYLRLPDVQGATALSRTAVYRHVNVGLLTRPVRLGERASGWPEHEIAAINAARLAGKPDHAIRTLVESLHQERQRADAA